jgi:quinol monooxygenase YgiN
MRVPWPRQGRAHRRRYGRAMTAEMRIGRYVRMVAQPGQGGALAGVLLDVAVSLRTAPGCELYVVNRSADEPDTVWVTEVWSNADASDRALSDDLGQAGIGDVLGLLAGPPELVDLRPLGGIGLRD